MELVNNIYQSGADKGVFSKLVIMLSPIAPHFCEELWQTLGNKDPVFRAQWPEYDPAMLVEDTITLVVQVNGKVRSKIEVAADISEEELKKTVLSDEKLKPWIQGKSVKRFIVVPKKLANIVL
jgi:leucyl-tRNA synthetase